MDECQDPTHDHIVLDQETEDLLDSLEQQRQADAYARETISPAFADALLRK